MATQAAIRVVAQINDFADMPYHIARPILLKVENPQQLRDIEVNCPHIAEQSEELWRRLIARDIPDWQTKLVEPRNKSSWNKIYAFLLRNEEKQAAADEEALRKAMQGEGVKKVQSATLVVKSPLPHPRGEDEGTKYIDGVARHEWAKKKQPNLKTAKTGKDMLSAIRRQTALASNQKSHAALVRSSNSNQQLASAKRQITQAPASMVAEIRKAQNQYTIQPRELLPHEREQLREFDRTRLANRRIIGPKTPGRLSDLQHHQQHRHTVEAARTKALAENEARLRAITQQQKKAASAADKNKKEFAFAPSPVVVGPAKRSLSPQSKPADKTPDSPPAITVTAPSGSVRKVFDAPTIGAVEVHTKLTTDEHEAIVETHHMNGVSARAASSQTEKGSVENSPKKPDTPNKSPANSPPPTQAVNRKRPATTNIFMTPKRRRV